MSAGAAILPSLDRVALSTSSRVVVLRLADGHPVAEYVRGPSFLSPPGVGPDGTIYVADADHHVYALRAASP
jgi:hypothetical protein